MNKFISLFLSFLFCFSSFQIQAAETHFKLRFNDTAELDAAIEQLDPSLLDTIEHVKLETFLSMPVTDTVDFNRLGAFTNLHSLEVICEGKYEEQHHSYPPGIAESLLTIPLLPSLEKLLLYNLHPEHTVSYSQPILFNEEAYPIDKIESFFVQLSLFPKLRSLTLSKEFFYLHGCFYYTYRGVRLRPLLHLLPELEELDLSEADHCICFEGSNFPPSAKSLPNIFFSDLGLLQKLKSLSFEKRLCLEQKTLDQLPQLPMLEELNLNNTSFHRPVAELHLPPLAHLKRLHAKGLRLAPIHTSGILLSTPFVASYPELVFLDLSHIQLDNPSYYEYGSLMDLNAHPTLEHLVLDGVPMTAAHIEQLNHMNFPSLTNLSLSGSPVRGVSWKQLAPQLKVLNLCYTNIGGKDIASIALLDQLEDLNLAQTKISGSSMKKLAKLHNLRRLSLDGNKLVGADFSVFVNTPSLEFLGLESTNLQMDDLEGLKLLRQVKVIDLRYQQNKNITPALLQTLSESLPNTKVLF